MVNASLNWASIVGIVLAVSGGGLYFLRSFKPELARDYDVFFAAIGLLCGGILFFQGWRLDPILQFGQFLLAGTAIFWGYESVRLRGVATDQARRSSYFEDDQMPNMPRNSSRGRFNDDYDQFEDSDRPSRRFRAQEDDIEDDYKDGRPRRRNISRAIPESAVSRRQPSLRESSELENEEPRRKRNRAEERRSSFGERRASRTDVKRGSRPLRNQAVSGELNTSPEKNSSSSSNQISRPSIRSQTSREKVEDASFSQNINEAKKPRQARRTTPSRRSTVKNQPSRYTVGTRKNKPRDNSSRFDD